jgi:hypothetical protein
LPTRFLVNQPGKESSTVKVGEGNSFLAVNVQYVKDQEDGGVRFEEGGRGLQGVHPLLQPREAGPVGIKDNDLTVQDGIDTKVTTKWFELRKAGCDHSA